MNFRIFFVLNRVRVSNPQRATYTHRLVEYPPPPAPGAYVHVPRFPSPCTGKCISAGTRLRSGGKRQKTG